jgi:beta-lactamase regulating signal transducer with metallopeptidase domain
MTPELDALAQLLASRMVDSLAWGTVTVVFAAMMLRVTRQNAGTRFAVWFSTLLAIGLVPWLVSVRRPGELISASTVGKAALTLPDQWALYLCGAWALISAWFVVGIGRAVWHLHVLRRDSSELELAELDSLLQETLRRHGASRRVALCTSDQVQVPTALGLLKPAIVFPRWVFNELPAGEVNQILLHELAHLRRWDDWTNLIQQAIKAIFFFHPAVWWIEKKVALEREMACDDAVVEETASPRAYAECLAHLAEKSFLRRTVVLAQAAIGRIRHTSLRVAEILKGNRDGARNRGWKPAVSMVAGFAVVCGLWSARVPKLIAFRESGGLRGTQAVSVPNFAQLQGVDAGITRRLPVTEAKFVTDTPNRQSPLKVRMAVAHPARSKPKAGNLVHLTASQPAVVPFTETVFFVIEGREGALPDVRVYQIQMFRVMILRSAEPASSAPQKET